MSASSQANDKTCLFINIFPVPRYENPLSLSLSLAHLCRVFCFVLFSTCPMTQSHTAHTQRTHGVDTAHTLRKHCANNKLTNKYEKRQEKHFEFQAIFSHGFPRQRATFSQQTRPKKYQYYPHTLVRCINTCVIVLAICFYLSLSIGKVNKLFALAQATWHQSEIVYLVGVFTCNYLSIRLRALRIEPQLVTSFHFIFLLFFCNAVGFLFYFFYVRPKFINAVKWINNKAN